MIFNPLTKQVLNSNPNGDNQYVNPDGPSIRAPRGSAERSVAALVERLNQEPPAIKAPATSKPFSKPLTKPRVDSLISKGATRRFISRYGDKLEGRVLARRNWSVDVDTGGKVGTFSLDDLQLDD